MSDGYGQLSHNDENFRKINKGTWKSNKIPASHAFTMPWRPFRHSEHWVYYTPKEVSFHSKENHDVLRICHILHQYDLVSYW